jgi:hypothetical protein
MDHIDTEDRRWRRGRFYVSKNYIHSSELAEVLSLIKFIPLHVCFSYVKNRLIMIGTSPRFDKVEAHEQLIECYDQIPLYVIWITYNEDGSTKEVTVRKEHE